MEIEITAQAEVQYKGGTCGPLLADAMAISTFLPLMNT
jgi:hypothetical protein